MRTNVSSFSHSQNKHTLTLCQLPANRSPFHIHGSHTTPWLHHGAQGNVENTSLSMTLPVLTCKYNARHYVTNVQISSKTSSLNVTAALCELQSWLYLSQTVVYVCVCARACVHACVHVFVRGCVCARLCVFMCMHICGCTHMRVWIHSLINHSP